jgi:hypothetical protein
MDVNLQIRPDVEKVSLAAVAEDLFAGKLAE